MSVPVNPPGWLLPRGGSFLTSIPCTCSALSLSSPSVLKLCMGHRVRHPSASIQTSPASTSTHLKTAMPRKQQPKGIPPRGQPSSSSRSRHSTAASGSFIPFARGTSAISENSHVFVPSSPGSSRISQGYDTISGSSNYQPGASRASGSFGGFQPLVASTAQVPLSLARPVEAATPGSAVSFGDAIAGDGNNNATLAMDMKTDGTLGCAYFSSDSNILFLLQEVASADMAWVDQLVFHARPAVVLLPARAPEDMIQHLESLAGSAVQGIHILLCPRRNSLFSQVLC